MTMQGLQVFSLDEAMSFAPTDLDLTITPQVPSIPPGSVAVVI